MTQDSDIKSKKDKFGPHGVGNPDDLNLRKMELNLLIPQLRREIVNKEKCFKEIEDYQNCVLKEGLLLASFKCRSLKVNLSNCLEYWNDDEEMFSRAKKLYLEERAEYRRTGVCKQNRETIFQHLEEKKKEQS